MSGQNQLVGTNPLNNASLSGDLKSAIDLCVKNGKWPEALILVGGATPEVAKSVQEKYLKASRDDDTTEMIRAIASKDWRKLVEDCDLKYWEATLISVLAHVGNEIEIADLAGKLGKRLEKADDKELKKGAMTCYVCIGHNDLISKGWKTLRKSVFCDDNVYLQMVTRGVNIMKKVANEKAHSAAAIQAPLVNFNQGHSLSQNMISYPTGYHQVSMGPPITYNPRMKMGTQAGSNPVGVWTRAPAPFPEPFNPYQKPPSLVKSRGGSNQEISSKLGYNSQSSTAHTASPGSSHDWPRTSLKCPNNVVESFKAQVLLAAGAPPKITVRPPRNINGCPPIPCSAPKQRVVTTSSRPPAPSQVPTAAMTTPKIAGFRPKKATPPGDPQSPPLLLLSGSSARKSGGFLKLLKSPDVVKKDYQDAINETLPSKKVPAGMESVPTSPISPDSVVALNDSPQELTNKLLSPAVELATDQDSVPADERMKLFSFLEDIRNEYCKGSPRPIQNRIANMLDQRIAFWTDLFQD